jgi:hypothetical protein
MKTKPSAGLKVKAGIKAAGLCHANHTHTGLKVKTGLKAGNEIGFKANHNSRLLAVR